MPLSEDDLDRIGDKAKLAVGQAMKEHQDAHDLLHIRINKLQLRFAWAAGAAAAAMMAFDFWMKTWPK